MLKLTSLSTTFLRPALALGVVMSIVCSSETHAQPQPPVDRQALFAELSVVQDKAIAAFAIADYRAAIVSLTRQLEIFKTLFPAEILRPSFQRQEFLTITNNLAIQYANNGEYEKAKTTFQELVALYGPLSEDRSRNDVSDAALGAHNALVGMYFELGELSQAETAARTNLAGRKVARPTDTLGVGRLTITLMTILIAQSKYGEAEQAYLQASDLVPSEDRERERMRAHLLSTLGTIAGAQGKYQLGERHLREALDIRKRHFPAGHPDITVLYEKLAGLVATNMRTGEALSLSQQAYDSNVAKLGLEHPRSIGSLSTLAIAQINDGKKDVGISNLRRAIEQHRRRVPIDQSSLAGDLNSLATMLAGGNTKDEVLALSREALTLGKASLPENHPNVLRYATNLAIVMADRGEIPQAIALHREAMATWRTRPEKWHRSKAINQVQLAYRLSEIGQRNEAYALQSDVGSDVLNILGATSGIDEESKRKLRAMQWIFSGQMQLGWFAAHPNQAVSYSTFAREPVQTNQ